MDSMRDRLLDAGARVVRERGLAAATIREIAKAAGVAEGSVYNHFKDKLDLMTALHVERMPIRTLSDAIHDLVTNVGKGAVAANLEEFARAAVEGYADLVPYVAAFSGDAEAGAAVRAELTRRRIGPFRAHEALAAYLRIEEEQGRAALSASPAVISAALLGACHEYAYTRFFTDEPPFGLDPDRFARQLVEAFVRTPPP